MFKVTANVVACDKSITKGRVYMARGVYDDGVSMVTLSFGCGRVFILAQSEIVSIEYIEGDIEE